MRSPWTRSHPSGWPSWGLNLGQGQKCGILEAPKGQGQTYSCCDSRAQHSWYSVSARWLSGQCQALVTWGTVPWPDVRPVSCQSHASVPWRWMQPRNFSYGGGSSRRQLWEVPGVAGAALCASPLVRAPGAAGTRAGIRNRAGVFEIRR